MFWRRKTDSVGQPAPGAVTRGLPVAGPRNLEFGSDPSGPAPIVPGLPYPGLHNRLTVTHEPHGADRRPAWRDVNARQWGAYAAVRFGQLIYNPRTAQMQIQQWGPRTLWFQDPRDRPVKRTPMELQNRPALEGPRYRFTAVNDTQVIAQARQRAQARVAKASGARGVRL